MPEFEQVQGEHVLYEYSSELHACAENAAHADRLVHFLEKQLGVTPPEKLRLSWIAEGVVPPWAYGEGGGYTIGRHAMSYHPVSIHELTHAVMGVSTARFFSEGVAVAMEIAASERGLRYITEAMFRSENWDPRPTLAASTSGEVNYAVAGGFVTYLLVTYGPDLFADFYRTLNGPVTMARIEAEFRRTYGVELGAVIDAFLQGVPGCHPGAFALPTVECMSPTVPWEHDGLWRAELSMDCDEPGVIGGHAPGWAWPSSRSVTVQIPEAGEYMLYLSNPAGVSVRVGPCFGCPWDFRDEELEEGIAISGVDLEVGKYYIRVGSQSDRSPDVTLSLSR